LLNRITETCCEDNPVLCLTGVTLSILLNGKVEPVYSLYLLPSKMLSPQMGSSPMYFRDCRDILFHSFLAPLLYHLKSEKMKNVSLKIIVSVLAATILISCDKDDNGHHEPDHDDEVTIIAAAGDSIDIISSINQFRSAIGDSLNTKIGAVGGRREINWDGVPATATDANPFPVDFFNATDSSAPAGRKRGLVYSPANASLRVSSTDFSDIDASYPGQFHPFSKAKMFNPNGSNVTEIQFKVAGTNTNAFVKAFGVVFADVDDYNSTTVEIFDGDTSLTVAKAQPSNGKFSFLSLQVSEYKITRVRITTGNGVLAAGIKDVSDGGSKDLVVMDDFIYSEPVVIQ
jgi:hypothetical protein